LLVDFVGERLAVIDDRVHCRFEAWAERTPRAVAASFEGEDASYEDLNERANRLAHHLLALGVGPETVVAIQLPRSLDLLVSVLAIHKAGGAYLPIELSYPLERCALLLEESGAMLVVSRSDIGGPLATGGPSGLASVLLDRDAEAIAGRSSEN